MPGVIASLDYAADGRTVRAEYANGVVSTFAHDPARRWLDRIETLRPDGVRLQLLSYARDAVGRIASVAGATARPQESWSYSYDGLDRLLEADSLDDALDQSFRYDKAGNLTFNSRLGTYSYAAAPIVPRAAPR